MLKRLVDPSKRTCDWPTKLKLTIDVCEANVVQLSPNKEYAAVGDVDGSLLIFDADTWSIVYRYRLHSMSICGISWSEDSDFLITVGKDWQIAVWHLSERKPFKAFDFDCDLVSVSFDPANWKKFCLIYPRGVIIVELDLNLNSTNEPSISFNELTIDIGTDMLSCVRFLNDNILCCGAENGQVHFILADGTHLKTVTAGTGVIKSMDFCNNANILAVIGNDKSIYPFHMNSFKNDYSGIYPGEKFTNPKLDKQFGSVTISDDGEYLFAAADVPSGVMSIWNMAILTHIDDITDYEDRINQIVFDQSRSMLVGIGKKHGSLNVWRADPIHDVSGVLYKFENFPDIGPWLEDEDAWDYQLEDVDNAAILDLWSFVEPYNGKHIPLIL